MLMQSITFQVWRVDCEKLSLLPASEERKIFSGDCYVVQYTYLGNERSENLFYAWLGCGSVMVSGNHGLFPWNLWLL